MKTVCCISAGPQEELSALCAKLKEEGVFVRELDTLGIAYHSPALMPFCGSLHSALSGVVPHPRGRSKRWLSTCYPLDSGEGGSQTCGPDYHVRAFYDKYYCLESMPNDSLPPMHVERHGM